MSERCTSSRRDVTWKPTQAHASSSATACKSMQAYMQASHASTPHLRPHDRHEHRAPHVRVHAQLPRKCQQLATVCALTSPRTLLACVCVCRGTRQQCGAADTEVLEVSWFRL